MSYQCPMPNAQCPIPNTQLKMRMARLELARSRPHAPQACAYTNSATSAGRDFYLSRNEV